MAPTLKKTTRIRGEAALRLTAEDWYLEKVFPSSFVTFCVSFFGEFSLFPGAPAINLSTEPLWDILWATESAWVNV